MTKRGDESIVESIRGIRSMMLSNGCWTTLPRTMSKVRCDSCDGYYEEGKGIKMHRYHKHYSEWLADPVPLQDEDGYLTWVHRYDSERDRVRVSQLLAILDGYDPREVFNSDTEVHHGPRIENCHADIPGNVQVLDSGDHMRYHLNIGKGELLDEIRQLSERLGRSPTGKEMREHGRYGVTTYRNHFGKWTDAVKEAGLEPIRASPSKKKND